MVIRKTIYFILLMFLILTFSFNHSVSAENGSELVEPGASLKMVKSGFQGTEGPATDADGNVWFTEVFGERIQKWSWKDGTVTLYRENTGQANGMMFDSEGNLVICEMGNGRVVRDDLKGNVTVIADSLNGQKVRMPNDLWIDPKGGIYISHMYMDIPTGGDMPGGGAPRGEEAGNGPPTRGGIPEPPSEMADELGIVYISPDGKNVNLVTNNLSSPNGLIGTPDGKILYAGGRGRVWSYKINPDGTLSNKKLFCEKNTDGMAMDEKNNVYLTSDRFVLVYSPAGELIEEIPMPDGGCSNVEFCGKDRKTLFITYQGYIYTLDMKVRGSRLPIDTANCGKNNL